MEALPPSLSSTCTKGHIDYSNVRNTFLCLSTACKWEISGLACEGQNHILNELIFHALPKTPVMAMEQS